jgi:trehalose 6-phosphate phosphatase
MATVLPRHDCGIFFEQLQAAHERLLILDYDGTIAPFCVDRGNALPYSSIPEMLDCLTSTCRTRVVVVTGRPARDIPPLLGLTPHPEIWGAYGLERLSQDGTYEMAFISQAAQEALVVAARLLEEAGLNELCETKPGALAVHWRGMVATHIETVRTNAYRVLVPLACRSNLLLAEFDGGIELRVRTACKGEAVRCLLSQIDEAVPVAYLGDDFSDESAFRALKGRGLSVLVKSSYRTTSAELWLSPPDQLLQFLHEWVHVCRGGR